jgi:hypothetical protein
LYLICGPSRHIENTRTLCRTFSMFLLYCEQNQFVDCSGKQAQTTETGSVPLSHGAPESSSGVWPINCHTLSHLYSTYARHMLLIPTTHHNPTLNLALCKTIRSSSVSVAILPLSSLCLRQQNISMARCCMLSTRAERRSSESATKLPKACTGSGTALRTLRSEITCWKSLLV